jgi:hypothetical protein
MSLSGCLVHHSSLLTSVPLLPQHKRGWKVLYHPCVNTARVCPSECPTQGNSDQGIVKGYTLSQCVPENTHQPSEETLLRRRSRGPPESSTIISILIRPMPLIFASTSAAPESVVKDGDWHTPNCQRQTGSSFELDRDHRRRHCCYPAVALVFGSCALVSCTLRSRSTQGLRTHRTSHSRYSSK